MAAARPAAISSVLYDGRRSGNRCRMLEIDKIGANRVNQIDAIIPSRTARCCLAGGDADVIARGSEARRLGFIKMLSLRRH